MNDLLKTIAQQTMPLLRREYPNGLIYRLNKAGELREPHQRHSIFYGCYDWHSSVHSHWQLLRIVRQLPPDDRVAQQILAELAVSFDDIDGLSAEHAYLARHRSFERPYGLAWLLTLCCELRQLAGNQPFDRWHANLQPLEEVAIRNIMLWLPKLPFPVRGGLHNQSAFSLCLVLDWAVQANRDDVTALIADKANQWFGDDSNAPIAYEPSASDFLSPTLATIELMRRVRQPSSFLAWLNGYLPDLTSSQAETWLTPVTVADENDGRLAHFAGLNFSRAWMLVALAKALPDGDERGEIVRFSAETHLAAGMRYIISDAYMLSHWVPSFAVYALTA